MVVTNGREVMADGLFQAFTWISLLAGGLLLIVVALWACGWAVVGVLKYAKVWQVLILCASIQRHGSNYRDQLFWQAIRERADLGGGEAQRIIDFVTKHRPMPPEDDVL